jgi:AcrR family transcriptional regulator
MPANRPHVDRDAKTAQTLDAAESLLLRDGYEATTMASVARAAGISSNAVYWYFSSKDDLLAAVLRRRQEQTFARLKTEPTASLRERVVMVLAELDSVANLTATVHERAEHSAAVAELHEAFHAEIDAALRRGFEDAGLAERDARQASAALIAMVEGIHRHSPVRDASARDELVLWALQRFVRAS